MSASSNSPGKTAIASAVKGVGQVVVNTSDLNRFRTFYEGVLGLPHVISLSLAENPHLRYGVFAYRTSSQAPLHRPHNGRPTHHRCRDRQPQWSTAFPSDHQDEKRARTLMPEPPSRPQPSDQPSDPGLAPLRRPTRPGIDDDLDAVIDLVVTQQAIDDRNVPSLGITRDGVMAELDALQPPWNETLRIICNDDDQVIGAVLIDWDIESGQSWVHGPWIAVNDDHWHEIGTGLVDAVMSQLPPGITKTVMTAVVGHRCMAALARQLGWSASEVNHVLRADAPTVAAWSIPSPPVPGELRTMSEEDVAAVRALHDVEFPGTYYSASELAARVTRGDQIVLIADGGDGRHIDGYQIGGYIAGAIQPDGDGYIDFLAVAPSARRSGLGRRLVVALCQQLMAESTTKRVCLTVQTTRSPARALYESLGFEQDLAIVGYEAPTR